MRRQPENLSRSLRDLARDKKVKPIFWIITVTVFVALIFSILVSPEVGYAGFVKLLIVPYFMFAVIYLIYVHRNDK